MKKNLLIIISISLITLTGIFLGGFSSKGYLSLDEVKLEIRTHFPNVNQMKIRSFRNITNVENIILLDVREVEEFKVSHIKNAELSKDIDDALIILKNKPKNIKIVAYCSVGYRSSALIEKLNKQGFTNTHNLEGSIFEWANKKFPVYSGGKKVYKVHPFDSTWGKLLDKTYHP